MGKRIEINKRIILLIVVIIVLLIGYYIYYKNSNIYKEFEITSNMEELLPYEEVKEKEYEKINEAQENKNEVINKEIMLVHITGEVLSPGVIELESGSRIIDAVNKAGGFTENADTEKVNLAYEVTDGVKIYIPGKSENQVQSVNTQKYITTDSGDNVSMEENKMMETKQTLVNINNATQTELETLPGIGPSTALKIISYREENGKFSSIEDIKNVSGIGDNKFENIRELISV